MHTRVLAQFGPMSPEVDDHGPSYPFELSEHVVRGVVGEAMVWAYALPQASLLPPRPGEAARVFS